MRHDTGNSEALFDRARRAIPGGVNSPVRAFHAVGGTPRFMDRGVGAHIWDVDGNQFIDFVMSWGPLIHGHAYGPVLRAIDAAAGRGTSFGAPTESEVQLAEMVVEAVPSIDMVRFVSSGTEATMSAIRLARGATGRDLVVKFAGNYHGHADGLLASAGSGSLTLGVPTSPGVPAAIAGSTLVVPYNDSDALTAVFARYSAGIAAVIVEPVAGNMGVVLPEDGFLDTLAALCRRSGALFICDEVITGFRLSYGGAQATLKLRPDLTTLGKIIGGGLPVGAYGGRRDLMEQMSPQGPIYQAGTLSGNPVAMAAGRAALEGLQVDNFYPRLSAATDRLAAGLRAAADASGVSVAINAVTGMLTVFFGPNAVTSLDDAQASDTAMYSRFFQSMLQRGVYLPPSQFEAWMIASVHDDDVIDLTIEAARQSMADLAQ